MEEMTAAEAKKVYKENNGRIVDRSVKSFICLKNVDKVYPNNVQAVFDFSLDVDRHDFVALVGPSGCGKSTTLRMIAGLEEISKGYLYIDGVMSNYLPSKDRDIAMVFQNYALYPQLNVYDNIAFGLRIRKTDKKEIESRVFEAADILDLGPYLDRKPKELSGGQMQRVALGRAIVRKAKLFLMDEPLSNLDAKLRVQMRSEIVRIHEEVGATTIYVTHDQTEAMTMANKIVVMNKGFIRQVGAPLEIYHNPRTLFVATFIGTPPMNILDCTYDGGELVFADGTRRALDDGIKTRHDAFLSAKLREINDLLADAGVLGAEELRKYLLSVNAYGQESKKEIEAPRKQGFFARLANKLKNNFIVRLKRKMAERKRDENEIKAEYVAKLEELAQKYREALAAPHPVKLGIRPEYVRLREKSGEATVEATSDIVEVLGSEFIAYAKSPIGKLVIKSLDRLEAHSSLHAELDFDKIHIFDPISEENMLFVPAQKEPDPAGQPRENESTEQNESTAYESTEQNESTEQGIQAPASDKAAPEDNVEAAPPSAEQTADGEPPVTPAKAARKKTRTARQKQE